MEKILGMYFYDGVDTSKMNMSEEREDHIDIDISEATKATEEVEISLYKSPLVFDFREKDAIEVIGYDVQELTKKATTFLQQHLSFLTAVGKVKDFHYVGATTEKTENKTSKQGSIITGEVKYTLRIVNQHQNRVLNMGITIPIKEGKFIQPTTFTSGHREHVLSVAGVTNAFQETKEVRIVFPDIRNSRRYPDILKQDYI